jgi:glycosyltransferase involved in cell wall biosynthesis
LASADGNLLAEVLGVKIAQIAPLYESIPPKLYGGTERIVSYLTEELVRQGHAVTLFASGDSVTSAELVPACERSLRLDETCVDSLAHHIHLLDLVFERAREFDILHFHIDYLHYALSTRQSTPHLTTLHGRLDLADLVPLYRRFSRVPLISISDSQRGPLPCANWQATIYHGLPLDLYEFHPKPSGYLAFVGRICPEKRPDRAIQIAQRAGRELKIAAKVDRVDEEYFKTKIEPLLQSSQVEFIGEIGEDEKTAFLGDAAALLFPVDWPEPFGLAMIESLACGTPVIAYRKGSVPEVIDPGETGFIVENIDEAVEAVSRIGQISRLRCRQTFEERFSAARMAAEYVRVYNQMSDANCSRLLLSQ